MRYDFILLSWVIILFEITLSVDASINTVSSYAFEKKIIKAQVSILEDQQ